ncbi:MAG: hypothetical protein WKF87_01820 [Chryseolinea sp.]
MRHGLIILLLVTFCFSCSTPVVVVKKNAPIEKLGIYFEATAQATPVIAAQFHSDLDTFISRYNSQPGRKFELFRASFDDASTLRIKLYTTRMVNPGQQVAGVVVSAIGLALPFVLAGAGSPYYVFFYHFPKVKSITELSLSPDINEAPGSRLFTLMSPGFLKSQPKQLEKHADYFYRMLTKLVLEIEKQSLRREKKSALALTSH